MYYERCILQQFCNEITRILQHAFILFAISNNEAFIPLHCIDYFLNMHDAHMHWQHCMRRVRFFCCHTIGLLGGGWSFKVGEQKCGFGGAPVGSRGKWSPGAKPQVG